MARRVTALLGIAVVIGLVLTLMWRVYVHRQSAGEEEGGPAIVLLQGEKIAERAT
jgi:hypothetical protein